MNQESNTNYVAMNEQNAPFAQSDFVRDQPAVIKSQQPQQPQMVYVAPPGVISNVSPPIVDFPKQSIQITCPQCGKTDFTKITVAPGLGTYMASAFVCLICCPCTCVPCCIKDLQDTTHHCKHCNNYIGVHKFLGN